MPFVPGPKGEKEPCREGSVGDRRRQTGPGSQASAQSAQAVGEEGGNGLPLARSAAILSVFLEDSSYVGKGSE